MKKMSIKTAILLPSLAVLIAGIIIMVVVVGIVSSSTTNNLTSRLMSARVNEYSNKFEALCLESYGVAESISPIISNYTEHENGRSEVIE